MSHDQRSAFVRGASLSMGWADASKSLTDLIFEGVSSALAASAVEMEQIDSVVLSAHDLIDGRSLSSMVTAPAAGAYLRDEIRLAEDGLVALSLATARIAAGESRLSVVAAWGRASEADFLNTSRASMDPFMLKPLGLSEFDVSAFRLSKWLSKYPGKEADRNRAAETRRHRASRNPRTVASPALSFPLNFPLRDAEQPRWADIVVAAVVGCEDAPVRVAGVGHSTDQTMIGDRDFLDMPALRAAASTACDDAGIVLNQIDLFEIDGLMLSDEVITLEALGLCRPGEGFDTYARSTTINPSGGAGAGWCYPAMGLVRFAECYLQLTGAAGAVQSKSRARTALAIGASPIGSQTQTAVVLEAE